MTDHKAQWMARYGSDYPTQDQRDAAYHLHQATLVEMRAIFKTASDSGS